MTRWKKEQGAFPVAVNYHIKRGAQTSIPKPIVEALGFPRVIVFEITHDTVIVRKGKRLSPPELRPLEETDEWDVDPYAKGKRLGQRSDWG